MIILVGDGNVPRLLRQQMISQEAADYLLQYARGEIPQIARPDRYEFLDYRWRRRDAGQNAHEDKPLIQYDDEARRKVPVVSKVRKLPADHDIEKVAMDNIDDEPHDGQPGSIELECGSIVVAVEPNAGD